LEVTITLIGHTVSQNLQDLSRKELRGTLQSIDLWKSRLLHYNMPNSLGKSNLG